MAGNSIKWLQQFPSSDQLVTSWPRHRNTSCLSRVTCHNYHETFVRVMSVSQHCANWFNIHCPSSSSWFVKFYLQQDSMVLFWIWPCVLVADRLACNKICIKLYDKKFPWPSCSDMSPWMFQILRRHLDNNSWLNVVGNHNFYCPSMILTFATLSWHLDWEVLVFVFRSPRGN